MDLHPLVSCLTLPSLIFLKVHGHDLDTLSLPTVCPGRTHTTTSGGCPVYVFNVDSDKKMAETTVMEFGE